ncbi:MAG: elongation factor P maturation arginine rhamnosyltransferase EarP [Rhodoferax sp.]|nr:elongation factor P maturation arginine rhamnosyltransferase EarP [Rhodoferax sp.]
MKSASTWDIFCRVIDNFGDIGVCWRLAADLGARAHPVRLWVDDPAVLQWMAPGALAGCWPGVTVLPWTKSGELQFLHTLRRSDVVLEGFGCEIEAAFLNWHFAGVEPQSPMPSWINLEYLSAQAYAEQSHRLPSPVQFGPAKGFTRHFFFPGFSRRSGGLLREGNLLARQAAFDRWAWLSQHGVYNSGATIVSLFCYEPPTLTELLERLQRGPEPVQLLVTSGRAAAAVRGWQKAATRSTTRSTDACIGSLSLVFLPTLTQEDYDHLLWSCNLNFVRGEDSLVRAIWAGKPFVWQIYPQGDAAHFPKLRATLDVLGAPKSWRQFHGAWNDDPAVLPAFDLPGWALAVHDARQKLLAQDDLTTRLLTFAANPTPAGN